MKECHGKADDEWSLTENVANVTARAQGIGEGELLFPGRSLSWMEGSPGKRERKELLEKGMSSPVWRVPQRPMPSMWATLGRKQFCNRTCRGVKGNVDEQRVHPCFFRSLLFPMGNRGRER